MALNIKVSSSDWIDLRTRGYTSGMYLLNAVGAAIEYSTAATPVPGTTLVGSSAVLISGTYLWVRGSGDCELYTASEWAAANTKIAPVMASTSSSGGVGSLSAGSQLFRDSADWTVWSPPPQPSFRDGQTGALINGLTCTAPQYIAALWEPLRAQYSDVLTREQVGTDQSGTYPIWKYVYTPKTGYDKTIVVGTVLHGNEVTTSFALYLIFRAMLEGSAGELAYLATRVRLVMIPVQNPWGMSQATRTRQNSRGVDVNRNFDYRWSLYVGQELPGQTQYKGDSAFSESESRAIRDVLLSYSDATCYHDWHNLLASAENYYLAYPQYEAWDINTTVEVIQKLWRPGDTQRWYPTYSPTAFNWAAANIGCSICNAEYPDGKYGQWLDSVEMTQAVRWFGNQLIASAYESRKASTISKTSPRIYYGSFQSQGAETITTTSTTYAEMTALRMSIPIDSPGLVEVSGFVSLLSTSAGAQIFVVPLIGQANTEWIPTTTHSQYFESYNSFASTSDRVTVPINCVVPVETTSANAGELQVGLFVKTTAGTAQVLRYNASVKVIPTEAVDRLQILSSTGAVAGGMVKKFPIKS